MADRPLRPATRRSLGGPLPRQLADGPRAHPEVIACIQRPPFPPGTEVPVVSSGISTPFGELFRASGQITHVLRTRAPRYSPLRTFPFDLHVLGTPPAFVLSQDQTLQLRVCIPARASSEARGMVCYELFCSLAGTRFSAFRRRLAIQFSKTELTLRKRETASFSAQDSRKSRGQPASSRGEACTPASRRRQVKTPKRVSACHVAAVGG